MIGRTSIRALIPVAAAIVTLALAAAPADARGRGHGHGHGHHKDWHGHRHNHHQGHYYAPPPVRIHHSAFVVPHTILVPERPRFVRYHRAPVWFGPHRHYHEVYAFPVYDEWGQVAYRPHAYCGAALSI